MVCEGAACGGVTEGTLVLVRAALDEPVALSAIAAGEVVVQVSNEDPERHASIGFPRRRVFARDERLLRELRASYEQGRLDPQLPFGRVPLHLISARSRPWIPRQKHELTPNLRQPLPPGVLPALQNPKSETEAGT
jgi:hypothetical protein